MLAKKKAERRNEPAISIQAASISRAPTVRPLTRPEFLLHPSNPAGSSLLPGQSHWPLNPEHQGASFLLCFKDI